jgi:hypothetical protein
MRMTNKSHEEKHVTHRSYRAGVNFDAAEVGINRVLSRGAV